MMDAKAYIKMQEERDLASLTLDGKENKQTANLPIK
jgi:hypothetical protein